MGRGENLATPTKHIEAIIRATCHPVISPRPLPTDSPRRRKHAQAIYAPNATKNCALLCEDSNCANAVARVEL